MDNIRTGTTPLEIGLMIDRLKVLMGTLDFICSVMTRQDLQEEEEIDRFQDCALFFGDRYRTLLNKDGTPKCHLLEAHVPAFLRKHKRLGIFGEDPVEREHRLGNNNDRQFCSVRNDGIRAQAIYKRTIMLQQQQVVDAVAWATEQRARNSSQKTNSRKKAKREAEEKEKKDVYNDVWTMLATETQTLGVSSSNSPF
jgi:hypothetical protein